jgi:hypothetical protein
LMGPCPSERQGVFLIWPSGWCTARHITQIRKALYSGGQLSQLISIPEEADPAVPLTISPYTSHSTLISEGGTNRYSKLFMRAWAILDMSTIPCGVTIPLWGPARLLDTPWRVCVFLSGHSSGGRLGLCWFVLCFFQPGHGVFHRMATAAKAFCLDFLVNPDEQVGVNCHGNPGLIVTHDHIRAIHNT